MATKIANVISFIRELFTSPVFPDDEDKTTRAKALTALLLNMLAFLFLATLGAIFIFVNKLVSGIILAILAAIILTSFMLLRRGRLLAASFLFTTGYWIIFLLSVIFTGRITTTFVALLVASTIIAGVLVGPRYTTILTTVTILIGLGLALLEKAGYPLPHIFPAPPMTSWLILTLSFLLAYTPVKIILEGTSRALVRARQSEKRYKVLFNEAPVMYITLRDESETLVITSCNDAFLETLGYQREEVIGQPLENFYAPSSRTKLKGGYQDVMKEKKELFAERDLVTKDDGIVHTLLQAIPIIGDEQKQATEALSIFLNITERKQAEEMLQANEELLRKIAENYPNSYVSIIEKDLSVGFTSGQEFRRRWLNPENFVGLTLEQVFGEHAPLIKEKYLKAFEGDEVEFELHINDQYQRYRVIPLMEDSAQVNRILSVAENITERKHAEMEHDRLLSTLEASLNEIYIFMSDTLKFEYVSRSALENLGYSMEEMETKTPLDIKPEYDAQSFANLVAPLRSGKEKAVVFQTVHQRADETQYPVEVHLQLVTSGEQSHFLAMIYDITERKQAEVKLQKQLDELRLWHQTTLGREERVIELKREVNVLLAKAGKEPKYL